MTEDEQLAIKELNETCDLLNATIGRLMALVARSFQLRPNPDGTLDTDYEDGDKPPVAATLAWGNYSAVVSLIANQSTGTATSHDVRQYLTGTGAPTATLTIITVSGDNAATEGWTIQNSDDLSHPGTGAGSGSFRIRATVSGNSIDTDPINWVYAAAPAGDTTAPTIPTALSATAQEGQVTVTFYPSSDPYVGEAGAVQNYDLEVNGVITVKSGVAGISQPLTQTIVGASEGTPSSTQSGANWQLVFGGAGFDTTADHFLVRGLQLSGDFTIIAKVASITSAAAFAKGGIGIFETLAAGGKRVIVYQQKNDKVQGRNRTVVDATDGGNLFNTTLTVGAYLRIKRQGDIFNMAYSTDRNTWTSLGSPNNPMAQSVYVGVFATSNSAGTPATIEIQELSINNAPDISHVITTSVPVTVRARARDTSNNVSSYGSSISETPLAVPDPVGVKFHPAHYLMADNGSNLSARLGYVTEISNLSYIKGLHVRYYWYDLETTQGNYTFNSGTSAIEQLYNACAAAGKRLILEIWTRSFGGSQDQPKSDLMPPYLLTYGGFTSNRYWTGGGWGTAVWRTAVNDRRVALYEALAARFEGLEFFEAIVTAETSCGNKSALDATDYSASAWLAQEKRLLTAARAAFPTTQVRCNANFISNGGSNAQMLDLLKHCRSLGVSFGGPDIFSVSNDIAYKTQAQNAVTGAFDSHNYCDEMLIHFNIEQPTLNSTSTASGVRTTAQNTYGAHLLSWSRATWTTIDWINDIKPELQAHPNTDQTEPTFGNWDPS